MPTPAGEDTVNEPTALQNRLVELTDDVGGPRRDVPEQATRDHVQTGKDTASGGGSVALSAAQRQYATVTIGHHTAAEVRRMGEVMQRYMLSYPEISFVFNHNNREMGRSSGNGELRENVASIFG